MKKISSKLTIILSIVLIMSFIGSITASAHNAYFLAIAIDESQKRYHAEIVSETKSHREKDLGSFFQGVNKKTHLFDADFPKPADDPDTDVSYGEKIESTPGTCNHCFVYTFPCQHWDGTGYTADATDNDQQLIQRVIDYPVQGLNDAISFIYAQTETKTSVAVLGRELALAADKKNGGSFTVDKTTVTVTKGKKDGTSGKEVNGIKANDYVKVSIGEESTDYIPYRCYKGYNYAKDDDRVNDPLHSTQDKKYLEKKCAKDVIYMDWKVIAFQGNYNKDVKNVTFSTIDTITKPDEFSNTISNFLKNTINSICSFLGLYNLDELMVNNGTRANSYSLGMYPKSWQSSIILLHVICQMVAWSLIGFSIIRMLWKKQLSTINVSEKIAMQEGIKNLILCGFLLSSFPLLFNFICRISYNLVDLFAAMTYDASINGLMQASRSGSTLGAVIVSLATLALTIYYNYLYFLRAITIAILFGLAPLCIYSISLGGKVAGTFTTFMKELLGQIFLQPIHALLLAFFCNITSTGLRKIELIILLIAFVPISNFVRKKVFGLEDGGMGAVAGALTGGTTALATGLTKAKGGKSSGSGGSSSSGEKDNVSRTSQKMNTAGKNPKGSADLNIKDANNPASYEKSQYKLDKNGNIKTGIITKKPKKKKTTTIKASGPDAKDTALNVGSALYHGASAIGNAIAAPAKIAGGVRMMGIDPSAGKDLIHGARGHLSSAKSHASSAKNAGQQLFQNSATRNLTNEIARQGAESVTTGDAYTSYDNMGEVQNGTFVPNNQYMDENTRAEVSAMVAAQHAAETAKNPGDIDAKHKQVLRNMAQNQIGIRVSDTGQVSVIRRTEDIRNKQKNELDKANPLLGCSRIRSKDDHPDVFPNR